MSSVSRVSRIILERESGIDYIVADIFTMSNENHHRAASEPYGCRCYRPCLRQSTYSPIPP